MELTRAQFELMAYIEKNGPRPYGLRELADTLCICAGTLAKGAEALEKNGLLARSGRTLSLTAAGLEALEPYRVRRAVILAAGFGSRMMPATADRPKPMVTVNGTRIIDTLLDALAAADIRDVTLVRGYKKERFDELLEKYPDLMLVDNDAYDTTNNISSVMAVLDRLQGGCYLCEADLYITDPGVIQKYQYRSNILGSWSMETDDWSFRMADGHITDYRKGNTWCYNYYGISFWTAEDCDKLRRDFREVWEEPDGREIFWEFVPLVRRRERYAVEIRPCRKQDIMEIDSFAELAMIDPTYREGGGLRKGERDS